MTVYSGLALRLMCGIFIRKHKFSSGGSERYSAAALLATVHEKRSITSSLLTDIHCIGSSITFFLPFFWVQPANLLPSFTPDSSFLGPAQCLSSWTGQQQYLSFLSLISPAPNESWPLAARKWQTAERPCEPLHLNLQNHIGIKGIRGHPLKMSTKLSDFFDPLLPCLH